MRYRRLLWPGLLALALVAVLLASSGRGSTAGTFNPTSAYSVSDLTPGAHANIVSEFHIPVGDYQFDSFIDFTPPEWGIAPGVGIPDGAIVAEHQSVSTLGLIGGGCNTRLRVEFDMMDATLDMGNTIPFEDPEVAAGNPGGDTTGDLDDQFDDDTVDGLPLGVTRYPDYLTRIFKDPGGAPLLPIARAYGQTIVAGIDVSLNFMTFNPGIVLKTPNGEATAMDPRIGYPTITVLQASGDPDTEPTTDDANTMSDFCSPLDVQAIMLGVSRDNPDTPANEGGVELLTNPGAGTYNSVFYMVSQRDADGDGIENLLDPCALTADPDWDPRATVLADTMPGDLDADGLPDACDPDPDDKGQSSGGIWDHDRDFYGNRADNCPLVANSAGQLGGWADTDNGVAADDNQFDEDSDGIGDACDPNPNNPETEGQQIKVCLVSQIDIGGGGGPPPPDPAIMAPCDPNAPFPGEPTPTPAATPAATPEPPPDSDGDGMNDDIDGCPLLAEDFDGFHDADGCPEYDNDVGGVCDPWATPALPVCTGADECPNVREDLDGFEDSDGCPDPDNDDDGFPDVIDGCPGTDYTAGPDGMADSGDEPLDEFLVPIQTREDYDGVQDADGCYD